MREKYSGFDAADDLKTNADMAKHFNICIEDDPGDARATAIGHFLRLINVHIVRMVNLLRKMSLRIWGKQDQQTK